MSGPTLAVWKFASCDGCQLSLLDCEDELLTLAETVSIAHFTEMSRATVDGPYDLSLVEGSITTPEDVERIHQVRAASRRLVTIGACATAGGIQGLIDFAGQGEYQSIVYTHPEYLTSLGSSSPVSAHVPVDYELHGCPVDRGQLLEVLTAGLAGRHPVIPGYSVCRECKARGTVCLLVAQGKACLGPVTRAGCGGLCPAYDRGCFGCFGPAETTNTVSLSRRLAADGTGAGDRVRLFRTFNARTAAFARAVEEQSGEGLADDQPSAGPARTAAADPTGAEAASPASGRGAP